MGDIRKRLDAATKAKMALLAIKGEQTYNEIASIHGVHPKMIQLWKKLLLEGGSGLFSEKTSQRQQDPSELVEELYKQIGQLKVELDWLKKKSSQLSF